MSAPKVVSYDLSLGPRTSTHPVVRSSLDQQNEPLHSFIKDITTFRGFPLSVLRIITQYCDVTYFQAQIQHIDSVLKKHFSKKFIARVLDQHHLYCSAIAGFCLKSSQTTSRTILLTKEMISALGKIFPYISEFSGDATLLSNRDLNVFQSFRQLTNLSLRNCRIISHEGVNNLYGIPHLKHVTLNGSEFLTYYEEYPKGSSIMTSFFREETLRAVNFLLDQHSSFQIFETDDLRKELKKPTDDELEEVITQMSSLSIFNSFSQESCRNLTDRSLKLFVERWPRLEQLILFDCRQFTLDGVRAIAKLPHLKILSLYGCRQVDETASRIFAHLPKQNCIITRKNETW